MERRIKYNIDKGENLSQKHSNLFSLFLGHPLNASLVELTNPLMINITSNLGQGFVLAKETTKFMEPLKQLGKHGMFSQKHPNNISAPSLTSFRSVKLGIWLFQLLDIKNSSHALQ